MTLDINASYIRQSDRNMVNQGTYNNPLVDVYKRQVFTLCIPLNASVK